MHLFDLSLIFALVGLAFYAVLGGADFGTGFWQLLAGPGEDGDEIREYTHHAIAPVWEANHVWLIFVLTVVWTAYPAAFGSIASTLSIPLFIAGIGIVLRGGAYAMRAGTSTPGEQRPVDTVFAVSSLLTPFALGSVIGGLASGRVHVGNPGGSTVSSWLNPTSIGVGILAVASSAYLAAVFLSADADRDGDRRLAERFRLRALSAGVAAGGVALAGVVVLRFDAHRIFTHLTQGAGLPALALSVVAGVSTLALVWSRNYEPARYAAALAVAATIGGWALAQNPLFLSDLTVRQAAAPHDTQVAVIVAVIAGGIVLFPSLALLFRLTLTGRLGHTSTTAGAGPHRASHGDSVRRVERGWLLTVALLVAGVGFLTIANTAWLHAIGVACLCLFVIAGFGPAVTELESQRGD